MPNSETVSVVGQDRQQWREQDISRERRPTVESTDDEAARRGRPELTPTEEVSNAVET